MLNAAKKKKAKKFTNATVKLKQIEKVCDNHNARSKKFLKT